MFHGYMFSGMDKLRFTLTSVLSDGHLGQSPCFAMIANAKSNIFICKYIKCKYKYYTFTCICTEILICLILWKQNAPALHPFFFFFFWFSYFVFTYGYFATFCMYTMGVPGTLSIRKRQDPLELELWVLWTTLCVLKTEPPSFVLAAHVLTF